MKQKSLWKVSISTLPEAEDAAGELLSRCFKEPTATYTNLETGVSTIACYLARKPTWMVARKLLKVGLAQIKTQGLAIGSGKIFLQKVRRENWAQSWKRHFRPIEIGRLLLVKPSWNRRRAKKKQAVVILDPGLSFGTGQHPTTRFCLQQLARHFSRLADSESTTRDLHFSFLDIGTGSGILAIAAAKLGCSPVEAFDFDPEAVSVARANARRNRVSQKIHLRQADVTLLSSRNTKQFSLVCANLISNLLISEQERILGTLKPGGVLVLAGILQTEFNRVQTVYEKAGLRLLTSNTKNEWKSGAFAKNEGATKKV